MGVWIFKREITPIHYYSLGKKHQEMDDLMPQQSYFSKNKYNSFFGLQNTCFTNYHMS